MDGISICLTAWNTQDYIEECLDSVANQTWFKNHDNWEILLGIDACEKTLEKVKQIQHKYQHLTVYKMTENVGTYVTSNTIMSLAKYDWLLRFDTDDIMFSNMIEKLFGLGLEKYDVVRFKALCFGKENRSFTAWGSHAVRKSVWKKYGGYRNWRKSADRDFLYRIMPEIRCFESNIPYRYRVHPNTLSYMDRSKERKELDNFTNTKSRKENKIQCTVAPCKKLKFVLKENNSSGVGEGISICLTAWNTQDYIEECLDSIANQTWFKTHDNWEILLGIDACEKTLAKVKEIMYKYKNLSIYMMDSNVGTYITTNTVMKLAKYDWLLRFDTDDIMLPNMVESLMLIKKEKQPCFVQYYFYNFTNNLQKKTISNYGARGSVFYSKSIFEKYGGYRDWKCAADLELLERLKNFVTYYTIKQPLFYRRMHDNNLTRNDDTGMKSAYRISLHKQIHSPVEEVDATIECKTQKYKVIVEALPDISFLIINRGGTGLDKVIDNINESFDCKKEIIVINQEDSDFFKRGQLFNIGYGYAKGKYLVLMDNDIITIHPFDIVQEYNKIKKPYLPFTKVSQITYKDSVNYTITKTEPRLSGFGAFAVVSKEDFKKSHGFSNLCMNWGAEDNIFNIKVKGFYRMDSDIGHITHPKRSTLPTEKHRLINTEAFNLYRSGKIEYDKDGFEQTTYEEVYNEVKVGVRYIGVKNISVTDDYIYKNILNKHYE